MLLSVLRFTPIIFLINAIIIGLLSSGYSAQRNTISSLVHEKLGTWQTANFIVCGLLTIWLAYYLRSYDNGQITHAHLIMVGILVLGFSLLLLGLLPADKPGQTTVAGQVHGAVFVISVVTQATLQLTLAVSNIASLLSWYLFISGIITVAGLLGMLLFPDMRGIFQRILVGAIMLWITSGSFWLSK